MVSIDSIVCFYIDCVRYCAYDVYACEIFDMCYNM